MKTLLYLGTDPTHFIKQRGEEERVVHYPVIKIAARSLDHPAIRQAFEDMGEYTHVLFTSKNAVRVFFEALAFFNMSIIALQKKTILAIGEVTGKSLLAAGLTPCHTALEETQEGMVSLLKTLDLSFSYVYMPQSSLSRPLLVHFLSERAVRYRACVLYDTVLQMIDPKPDLDQVDEIVFTSPSTVQAFVTIFRGVPKGKKCTAIGPVTQQALLNFGLCDR
jgi:uroporphyrinogen-III synthase